jgi:hypothetical protein
MRATFVVLILNKRLESGRMFCSQSIRGFRVVVPKCYEANHLLNCFRFCSVLVRDVLLETLFLCK